MNCGSSCADSPEEELDGSTHTPFSEDTSSDEVLVLAREWIEKCANGHADCPKKASTDEWYPSRLLDLGKVIIKDGRLGRDRDDQVRLVSRSNILRNGPRKDSFYVTLSHRWGGEKFTVLTEDKLGIFQRGIDLQSLPQTFQDAVHFARRLDPRIRYIWIDSLCIIQDQRHDWLHESAEMYQIYNHSYCNLSATAAVNSESSIFRRRRPQDLWEDDVNLNLEGIPETDPMKWQRDMEMSISPIAAYSSRQTMKRCRILDLSFWERNIQDAPVNRRGWVLQERLMAPRVLHFCQDQIAWECRQLEAAENSVDGLSLYSLKAGDVVPGDRLKALLPHRERRVSLSQTVEDTLPIIVIDDPNMYERWNRVVEIYSKTQLTNAGDKLIALSGIAKMMFDQIGGQYVAGMWLRYLECQLLWRVDPVYENGRFYSESRRPPSYRAPTFSWAAVDAPQGVNFSPISERDLLFKVRTHNISLEEKDNQFGLIATQSDPTYLELEGVLKRVEMVVIRGKVEGQDSTRYGWRLINVPSNAKVSQHRNVCLDSDLDDSGFLGPDGHVYCMPARKDSAGYLICLMLQMEIRDGKETGNFRRIGVTKVPPYESGQKLVLELSGEEATIPHSLWVAKQKRHIFRVV
jgi:hypothetical protein